VHFEQRNRWENHNALVNTMNSLTKHSQYQGSSKNQLIHASLDKEAANSSNGEMVQMLISALDKGCKTTN